MVSSPNRLPYIVSGGSQMTSEYFEECYQRQIIIFCTNRPSFRLSKGQLFKFCYQTLSKPYLLSIMEDFHFNQPL